MSVQPVSILSIVGMALTLIISAGLPVALFMYCRKNYEVRTSAFVIGLIIYYVAAKVLEPFINAAILSNVGGAVMNNVYIYAIYVGLIAAVIEELCRYFGLKSIVRNVDEANAFYFGVGFCGLEAVLTAAWPQISNILNSVLINNGMMQQSLSMLQEPDLTLTYNAIAPLWETASTAFLLAGIERACIIVMHLSLSLLVFYFVKTGNKKLMGVAVAGHFIVVADSALLGQLGIPGLSVVVTAAVSAALVVFTMRSRKEYLASIPMGEYAVIEKAEALEEEDVQDN
jgi:uncharacterized membrane protein YhfC